MNEPLYPQGAIQVPKKEDTNYNSIFEIQKSPIWRWHEFSCEDPEATMDRDKILFQEIKTLRTSPILRFYRWNKPCLSYGRTAKLDLATELECRAKHLSMVRRPTGGGKVLHQDDLCFSLIWKKEDQEIPWKINDSYCAIHQWIQKTMIQLGIESKLLDQKNILKVNHDQLHQKNISLNPNPAIDSSRTKPARIESLNCESKKEIEPSPNIQSNWCFDNPVRFDLISQEKKLVGSAQFRDQSTALHQGSIQIQFKKDPLEFFQKSFENFFKVKLNVYSAAH